MNAATRRRRVGLQPGGAWFLGAGKDGPRVFPYPLILNSLQDTA